MADIRLLTFSFSGSAKGLVLGNKEGFYRDLGSAIFNNNDFVRIAVYYSMNSVANPNTTSTSSSPEYVANTLPSDYFYFGFKTPNANFPDFAELQSKFCGYYMPPRGSSITANPGNLLQLGWSGSPYNNWGRGIISGIGDGCIVGNLNVPYTNTHILTTAYNALDATGSHRAVYGTGTSSPGLGVLGLELRSDNTLLADFSIGGDPDSSTLLNNPALSAMTSYLNNRAFLSKSVSLASSAPYGQATAIFMFNPLTTTCIRVHGIVAAGYSY